MTDVVESLLEAPAGGFSTMRLCVLLAVGTGMATVGAGLVGFFLQIAASPLIVGSGESLIALALGAKAWQRTAEVSKA